MTRFTALFVLFLGHLLPSIAAAQPLTVFAAASLRGVLEDIARDYDPETRLSFGGSGTMARQIAAGAPADLVILANTLWADWLVSQGAISGAQPVIVAQNTLVVIATAPAAPLSQITDLPSKLGKNRLAMGQRDAVPAGRYARQWLQSEGLWPDVQNQLAETDNVRAALALVARGEVPMGLVYATDARAEPRVDVIWNVPAGSHDPILYPAIPVTPSGADFLAYLASPKAAGVFAAHGFAPVSK